MEDNSYEAYKRDFANHRKKLDDLRKGKILLVAGIYFLLYLLYIFPFRTGSADEIRGDEMKAGSAYNRIQIYYIEDLQLLYAKADTEGDNIYCIAKFTDCNNKHWITSFTPGKDKALAKKIQDSLQYSNSFNLSLNLTVSGYFQMHYLESLPSANSFYSIHGSQYADPYGTNMLNLNADYLCKKTDNYMLALLSRPGIALGSLVLGLVGVIYGSILLIQNRTMKAAKN